MMLLHKSLCSLSRAARRRAVPFAAAAAIALGMILPAGCQRTPLPRVILPDPQIDPAIAGLEYHHPVEMVEAVCAPPRGWRAEPLENTGRHAHKVWVSPTGHTAYGVIRINLPLPVGPDLVLRGFLREMRRSEGVANLLERNRDADLPGIRFIAEGARYTIHTNLVVHGRRAWAIYAGVLRNHDVLPDELALAERAREHTAVGLPADHQSQVNRLADLP
jgi:hypothetical protein